MPRETYRVRETALAILSTGSERIPVILPINAILVLVNGPLDGIRMVDVEWEGRIVMMFTHDMRNRCDRVDPEADIDLTTKPGKTEKRPHLPQ